MQKACNNTPYASGTQSGASPSKMRHLGVEVDLSTLFLYNGHIKNAILRDNAKRKSAILFEALQYNKE